ncbi:MAG: hypothetical protein EBY80_02040 [Actinobacteria bacterium]|nr:hypothetical protein [Actinomycetota bacterium]
MAAIITNDYRLYNAKQFVESIKEPFAGNDANANTHHYVFIGRPQSWSNDNAPPTPVDTIELQFDVYKDMIAMKRVYNTDVAHVVPREDWVSGTVYDEYNHKVSSTNPAYSGATSLFLSNFYVMTNDYKVYKCLFNNNNGASTTKPTSTSTDPVTYADGYIWKYMYTISVEDVVKFVTPEFMPVFIDSTVRSAARDGSIDVIKITYAGSTYASTPSVQIIGDGASAAATVNMSGSTVANVSISNRGNGYHVANVVVSGGNPAANATASAVISPPGGHGYNAVDELGAYYVMVNSRLTYAEGSGDFPAVNDFRRIGMLVDPQNYSDNTRASANTLTAVWALTTSNTSAAFAVDEVITGNVSGAKARVLSTTDPVVGGAANTRIIQPLSDTLTNQIDFQVGDYITGANSGSVGYVTNLVSPEAKPHSGSVIYVDNRRPVSRHPDQAESIHIVIEF